MQVVLYCFIVFFIWAVMFQCYGHSIPEYSSSGREFLEAQTSAKWTEDVTCWSAWRNPGDSSRPALLPLAGVNHWATGKSLRRRNLLSLSSDSS